MKLPILGGRDSNRFFEGLAEGLNRLITQPVCNFSDVVFIGLQPLDRLFHPFPGVVLLEGEPCLFGKHP